MKPIKRLSLSVFLSIYTSISIANTFNYNDLPDIGTAATTTLSVEKEIEYGDAYMRTLRASQPIVHDPLISDYVSTLGASLVANSRDVKTPFSFFVIQEKNINAFAFFGGHIALHSGLFLYAKNQSELASVMAHEIAHLTQRHLARAMEDQAQKTPLTMAALIGSLILAVAVPHAGIAALQATGAASIQNKINYTRSNEQEADRIGIDILARSGFNAASMSTFFGRLADQSRYSSKPPQLLLTHPLPTSRLTEARSKAQQFAKKTIPFSSQYHLARARIVARFLGYNSNQALNWFNHELKTASPQLAKTLNYGKALVYLDSGKLKQAETILKNLYKQDPKNLFYLDAMTDLNLAQKKYQEAIKRLDKALKIQPDNRVLLINRDYAWIKAGEFKKAQLSLQRYSYKYPDDQNAWSLLRQANEKQGNRHGALAAEAELLALQAKWNNAINNFIQASNLVELGSLDQARYDARIDQLHLQRSRFNALKK